MNYNSISKYTMFVWTNNGFDFGIGIDNTIEEKGKDLGSLEQVGVSVAVEVNVLAQNNSNESSTFGEPAPAGGFFGLSNCDTLSNLMAPKLNDQNSSALNEDNENSVKDANYDPQQTESRPPTTILEHPDSSKTVTPHNSSEHPSDNNSNANAIKQIIRRRTNQHGEVSIPCFEH